MMYRESLFYKLKLFDVKSITVLDAILYLDLDQIFYMHKNVSFLDET